MNIIPIECDVHITDRDLRILDLVDILGDPVGEVIAATQNSYERSGLAAATGYLFRVQSVDHDTNESSAATMTMTRPPASTVERRRSGKYQRDDRVPRRSSPSMAAIFDGTAARKANGDSMGSAYASSPEEPWPVAL